MTTENETVSTAPETQNPAPEVTTTPEAVTPDATADAAPEGESPEKTEKTAEQKELEYLRRKATKADRNNARLYQEAQSYREQLERLKPSGEEAEAPQANPYELAREIATVERITEKSNSVAKDGEKRFSNFTQSVRVVADEAGPLFNERGMPTNLGSALMESDDPAALMDYLGTNPSLAADLEGLSPTQLGRRIERIEAQMKVKPVKHVSNAPPPIKPIAGGTSGVNRDLESASMAEYKALRAKQGARWAR